MKNRFDILYFTAEQWDEQLGEHDIPDNTIVFVETRKAVCMDVTADAKRIVPLLRALDKAVAGSKYAELFDGWFSEWADTVHDKDFIWTYSGADDLQRGVWSYSWSIEPIDEDRVYIYLNIARPEYFEAQYEEMMQAEQNETEQNEQEADTMNANQTETVKMISVNELTEGIEPADIVKNMNDYRDSTQYICDIITEIADGCTSIYYADIMAFIAEHPWALADVIEEGLFDPSENYDVYMHGQAAEFMLNERELYNGMEEGLLLVARDMLRYDFEVEEIPETLADEIREFCENEDGNSRMSDLVDLIREAIEAEEVEA